MSIFTAVLFAVACVQISHGVAPLGSVKLTIDNFSGKPIHLFWISFEKKLVAQTSQPILNSSSTVINSYNTHRFRILEEGQSDSDFGVTFAKGMYEETVSVFTDKKGHLQVVQVSKYDEFHNRVVESQEKCGNNPKGRGYSKCLSRALYKDVEREEKAHAVVKHYRDEISNSLRNYTCKDPNMRSSPPLSAAQVLLAGQLYHVSTLLDMPAAKVWTVENFVSEDECAALIKHGSGKLTRATVAGEDGLFTVSQSRRAQQASYRFTHRMEDDPLWDLYNRIFEFTNKHTDYGLELPGQEGFTIIQYNPDDEYQPHCDGACDGSRYLNRGRVATAIVYCMVPERGGGTSFTKANLFVKPEKGMATFFAYKGADDHMDTGFTEHSGCPILQGEKWISTVWMRQGVDDEHDWQNVDPAGERVASVVFFEPDEGGAGAGGEL